MWLASPSWFVSGLQLGLALWGPLQSWLQAWRCLLRPAGTIPSEGVVIGLGSQTFCKGSGILGGSIYSNLAQHRSWVDQGCRHPDEGRPAGRHVGCVAAHKKAFPPSLTCKAAGWRSAANTDYCSSNCGSGLAFLP